MKLIDKDALVAEIKRRIKSTNNDIKIGAIESLIVSKTLNSLISFLNTLKVKEVDLEKEIEKEWLNCDLCRENTILEYANMDIKKFRTIAKHFFELGMRVSNKAQKGEGV